MTHDEDRPGAADASVQREAGSRLIPADLLEILCCPFEECRQPLVELVSERKLACQGCGRRYGVDDHGTPNLLREEAEPPPRDV